MMTRLTCARCYQQYRPGAADADQWNATLRQGRIVGLLCPACQTPEENAEAEINQATLTYRTDDLGRSIARPKAES
jgi:hypothetical protein